MHGAYLLVEGKKMSKSLGNYFTLRDLLAKGFTGREVRYLLLTAHYRESFNFTLEGLQGARAALARVDEWLGKLREVAGGVKSSLPNRQLLAPFVDTLDNDFNVSAAWGLIFEWVRNMNKAMSEGKVTPLLAAATLAAWDKIDSVLGVGASNELNVPEELSSLLEARQAARKARDFKRSDAIRDELKAKGWAIEDTPKGPRLKRL